MIQTILDKDSIPKILKSLNRSDLKFYQFYNIAFNADEYQFQEYMQTYKEGDAASKILNKSYYDIEVKYDP